MPARAPVQYTIRGVPGDVDQALRKKAHQRKISLNRLLVEELTAVTGTSPERTYRSLKTLAGRWKRDPEFDRILQEQRQIDESLWR